MPSPWSPQGRGCAVVGWDVPLSGMSTGNISANKHFSIGFRIFGSLFRILDIIIRLFSSNTPSFVKVYFHGARSILSPLSEYTLSSLEVYFQQTRNIGILNWFNINGLCF